MDASKQVAMETSSHTKRRRRTVEVARIRGCTLLIDL
jgi:hypothetical protein